MSREFQHKLIVDHMEMAAAIATDVATKFNLFPILPYDDVLGYAQQGLVEAARRYSPESGTSFRTFSWTRIRGAIIDGVRKHSRHGYRRADSRPDGQSDNLLPLPPPSDLTLESVADEKSVTNPPEVALDARRLRSALLHAIEALPPREREITIRHYYRGEEFVAISRDHGLSHDYVGRLHADSIRQLRTSLAGSLVDYLASETVQ